MTSQRLVKILLRLFILSIVGTALAGLYVLAVPSQNWDYEIKVLLTTATIAGASICGLACGGCLLLGQRTAPMAGLALNALSACLILIGIWAQPWRHSSNWDFWEGYWKLTTSLTVYAIAFSHLSLLLMARLAGAYRWAYVVAYYLILGLATVVAAGILFEYFDKEEYWRTTGALSIMVAAITLMIPVFHRFSRDLVAAEIAATDPLLAVEAELAQAKKRVIELENQRRILLGRTVSGENQSEGQ